MVYLMVVNTDKNRPIVGQELSRDKQSGIHHGEPSRMIPSARLRVAGQQVSFRIDLSCELQVRLEGIGIIVRIDEVLAGIVGGININQLDAAEVRLDSNVQQ